MSEARKLSLYEKIELARQAWELGRQLRQGRPTSLSVPRYIPPPAPIPTRYYTGKGADLTRPPEAP